MKQYRALVIEDEPVFRRYFSHLLEHCREFEFAPTHVGTAEQANELLEKGERFDVLFVDYFLPGSNGSAVIEKARSLDGLTPIICISSNSDYKIALELMELGADYYISKVDLHSQAIFDRMMRSVMRETTETPTQSSGHSK